MSRRRLFLVLAPWAFLSVSMLLTRWARAPVPPNWAANEIAMPRMNEVASVSVFGPTSERLNAATRQREAEWRERLGEACHVWSSPPFVLAGDVDEATLRRVYRRTVLPATRALVGEYFERLPDEPITLLVFKDTESYVAEAERLFGDRHLSVYGYYRPDRRTVVANLATGGGTLVHELTHALMDFDFPDAPAWFQEGFASLHEHGEFVLHDGRYVLRGLPNWREHDLPPGGLAGSLEQLLTRRRLQGEDELVAYASSRHLCLFLQQQGKLADCYRALRTAVAAGEDPHGVATLRRALAAPSLSAVESSFRDWVETGCAIADDPSDARSSRLRDAAALSTEPTVSAPLAARPPRTLR
ncbi:MAG TPA: hypothetical protein DCQ98_11340 [Planctomycetaceae bacterium]|nr:hypothetical protein [Planctomycetaceae bacterium]HRE99386.1 hypothetical protein [Pirellulaceae bacterium]